MADAGIFHPTHGEFESSEEKEVSPNLRGISLSYGVQAKPNEYEWEQGYEGERVLSILSPCDLPWRA